MQPIMKLTPETFFQHLYDTRRNSKRKYIQMLKRILKPTPQQLNSIIYWKSVNKAYHMILQKYDRKQITAENIISRYADAETLLDILKNDIHNIEDSLDTMTTMVILTTFNEIKSKLMLLWQQEDTEEDDIS